MCDGNFPFDGEIDEIRIYSEFKEEDFIINNIFNYKNQCVNLL